MTYRQLYNNLSDEEFIKKMLDDIDRLHKQKANPKDTICKHCITISLCQRYEALKEIGYIK